MAGRRPSRSRVLLEVNVPRAWLVGAGVALALLVALAVAGFSLVNRVDTCRACHLVRPEVDTYKRSAHYRAGVGCQKCHTKPGVFNYAIRNLQGLTNLILYASDTYERPLTAFVGADICAQCHPKSEIEKDQVVGTIRVNHKGLREAGYQCLTCHANISHPGIRLEAARVGQSTMAVCARCHDGRRLPDRCDLCHIGAVPAGAPKVTMTVKVSASECAGCHTGKTFCSDCHNGLAMPHPAGWQRSHGGTVLDRGRDVCVACHLKDDPKFCLRCHGLPMPHPGDFRASHGVRAQQQAAVCARCHGKDSCQSCHGLPMPHPAGWLGDHPATARSWPTVCGRCHSSGYCASCHGVTLPHGDAFLKDHARQAVAHGTVCVKCHGNGGAGQASCYGGECHAGGSDP